MQRAPADSQYLRGFRAIATTLLKGPENKVSFGLVQIQSLGFLGRCAQGLSRLA